MYEIGSGARPERVSPPVVDPASGWEPVSPEGGCLVSLRKLRDPSDRPETLDLVATIEIALKRGSQPAETAYP